MRARPAGGQPSREATIATVLDSLLVEIGLDGSRFDRGARQTREGLRQVSEAGARVDKDLDAVAKHIALGFQRVRNEVLGLFAVVTAGRGIKQLVQDITGGDAATGRLAASLGMATSELAAWQGVAERSGGTASGIAGSIQALSADFERFKLTGQGGETWIPYLNMLGVGLTDAQGKLKSFSQLYLDVADKLRTRPAPEANFIGAQLHMDPGTVATLRNPELRRLLAEQVKLGVPTDADAAGAQRLLNDVKDLQQAFTDFGRSILREVTPALDGMMRRLITWIEENGPRLKTEIADRLREFIRWLEGVDWTAVLAGIGSLIDKFRDAVGAIEGMNPALRTVLAFVAGAWLLGMLGPIARVTAALLGITAGLGGALDKLGLLKAGVAGLAVDQALRAIDPEDRFGSWIDRNVPGAAWIDDWAARNLGIGRTYDQQRQAEVGTRVPPPLAAGESTARERQAMGYFKGQGWTHEQAAGLVANLIQESGLRENIPGDNGQAYGIAQWHDDRRRALAAAGHRVEGADFARQLEAVQYELTRGAEKAAGDSLRAARTAAEAGAVVSREYERPGLNEDARRAEAANRARMAAAVGVRNRPAPPEPPPPAPGQAWRNAVPRAVPEVPPDGAPGGAPLPGAAPDQAAAETATQRLLRETREMLERHRAERERLEQQRPGPQSALPVVPPITLGSAAQRWGALAATESTNNDNSVETSINGPITIHTAATDARGIAGALRDRLADLTFAGQANRGLA